MELEQYLRAIHPNQQAVGREKHTGIVQAFETIKPNPVIAFPNKATPNPLQTDQLTGGQEFKYLKLGRAILF